MRCLLVSLALLTIGCGQGTVTAPTGLSVTAAPSLTLLSGQSNALYLGDTLGASFIPDTSLQQAALPGWRMVVQAGLPITVWAVGTPGASLFLSQLPGVTRVVWWQGESDAMACNSHYAADLREWLARIHAVSPDLPVVLIQIGNISAATMAVNAITASCWGQVRADIETVSHDPHMQFVSADDAEMQPHSVHFTEAGYRAIAARLAR